MIPESNRQTVEDFEKNVPGGVESAKRGKPVLVGQDATLVSQLGLRALTLRVGEHIGVGLAVEELQTRERTGKTLFTQSSSAYQVVGFAAIGDTETAADIVYHYIKHLRDAGVEVELFQVIGAMKKWSERLSVGSRYLDEVGDVEALMSDVISHVRNGYQSIEKGDDEDIPEVDLPDHQNWIPEKYEYDATGLRDMISPVEITEGIDWSPQSLAAHVGSEIGLRENSAGVVFDPGSQPIAKSRTELSVAMSLLGWIAPEERGSRQLWGNRYRVPNAVALLRAALRGDGVPS